MRAEGVPIRDGAGVYDWTARRLNVVDRAFGRLLNGHGVSSRPREKQVGVTVGARRL